MGRSYLSRLTGLLSRFQLLTETLGLDQPLEVLICEPLTLLELQQAMLKVRARYRTTTLSLAPRPNVSGWYISSALGGGTIKVPGVVARARYE